VRIWDVDPGFLNDKSLLGEHRELHGIFNIITMGKKGYSRHPETLRWVSHIQGLFIRHELLVCEMRLRGFRHQSPLDYTFNAFQEEEVIWPAKFLDQPAGQYALLQDKYREKEKGRIPLPRNTQELWARHKYSSMARSYPDYRRIGKAVADGGIGFAELSYWLVRKLRSRPSEKSLANAIMHMWGYVSERSENRRQPSDIRKIFAEIQNKVFAHKIEYLLFSTALGELGCWLLSGESSTDAGRCGARSENPPQS
jgi:hypothetical protein